MRVKPLPSGLTVAFEEKVNVMLGDSRGASDFGPSCLDGRDWEALENSRVVCSVNWAANQRGTELLIALRRHLRDEKTIFIDAADFRDRVEQFSELLEIISKTHLVDWVSSNELEARAAASSMGLETAGLSRTCRELAWRLGVVYDLHATGSSYTSDGTRVSSAPVNRIRPRRLTGAGDVWDAGAIYGRLKGMDEVPRLEFANRVAKLYLESEVLIPPTLEQVRRAED